MTYLLILFLSLLAALFLGPLLPGLTFLLLAFYGLIQLLAHCFSPKKQRKRPPEND